MASLALRLPDMNEDKPMKGLLAALPLSVGTRMVEANRNSLLLVSLTKCCFRLIHNL